MENKYPKKSLLDELKENGLLEKVEPNNTTLPFGNLTNSNKNEETKLPSPDLKIIKKRLNDVDFNFFQESNFLDIEDIDLTDDEKAEKIQKLIDKIDEKIYMLEDSVDEILLKKLNDEKEALNGALSLLGQKDFINMRAFSIIGEKLKLAENIIFSSCPFLKKIYMIKNALNKLMMLNETTSELMSKRIPYGEQEGRYSDFIAYLNCANVINAKLRKKIK